VQELARIVTVHKRTEITIETDHVVVVRRRSSRRGWCSECGHEVEVVGLSEAGLSQMRTIAGGTQPLLGDSSGIEKWHVFEDRDGSLVICLTSMLKSRQE
jgi:hypothetical protein